MKPVLYIGKEPNFQTIIITSAVIHVIFIALIAVPIKTKQREYKSYLVNIVTPTQVKRGSKSVKGVKQPVKKKVSPRKRVRSKKGVSLESAEKVSKEIERLRAINALAKKKKKKEVEISRAEEKNEEMEQALADIRKKLHSNISKGLGIPSRSTSADAQSYYAIVTREIWSEWIPPDYSATGLEVIISITINREGKVVAQEVEKSSGNILFDRSATKAITKASPLPPPPVEVEIGVRFYL